MRQINWRAPGNYDVTAASDDTAFWAQGESLTVQAHAEDADINVLMKRYGITGKMPEDVRIPTYGDFTEVRDYRTALEAVRSAHESFMEIPADVRSQFNNDPQLLLEFCSNPANGQQMVNLGLAKLRTPPQTDTAQPQATPQPVVPPTTQPVPKPAGTT